MRFEIRYFFLEIGLSPSISNLIIYFRIPRACLRHYTVRATVYSYTDIYTEFCSMLKRGVVGGGLKFLY